MRTPITTAAIVATPSDDHVAARACRPRATMSRALQPDQQEQQRVEDEGDDPPGRLELDARQRLDQVVRALAQLEAGGDGGEDARRVHESRRRCRRRTA